MKQVETIKDIEENVKNHLTENYYYSDFESKDNFSKFLHDQIESLLESAPLEKKEWELGKLIDCRMIDGWNNKIKDFESWINQIKK